MKFHKGHGATVAACNGAVNLSPLVSLLRRALALIDLDETVDPLAAFQDLLCPGGAVGVAIEPKEPAGRGVRIVGDRQGLAGSPTVGFEPRMQRFGWAIERREHAVRGIGGPEDHVPVHLGQWVQDVGRKLVRDKRGERARIVELLGELPVLPAR